MTSTLWKHTDDDGDRAELRAVSNGRLALVIVPRSGDLGMAYVDEAALRDLHTATGVALALTAPTE